MIYQNKKGLKTRCDDIGIMIRLIFWGYLLYLAAMFLLGLWLLAKPENDFSIHLFDIGNGLEGYGFYQGSFEIDFVRNALNDTALRHPKTVYMIGYLGGYIEKIFLFAILWNIRRIFLEIDIGDSPFINRSCKAIFHIAIIIIILGFFKSGFLSTVFGILNYGNGSLGSSSYWWHNLIVGEIIICLSYVFEYGTALQTESDETL